MNAGLRTDTVLDLIEDFSVLPEERRDKTSLSAPWRHTGGIKAHLPSFSTSAPDGDEQMEVRGQLLAPAALTSVKYYDSH